jgi:threonine dehydrogenase-like Zn-dependent dehydrogenase
MIPTTDLPAGVHLELGVAALQMLLHGALAEAQQLGGSIRASMRAVVCSNAELEVVERPEPVPARGHVRIEVLRCGICGSDLHARHGCDAWADLAARVGYHRFARSEDEVVFGHEFCGEVAEHGPGCRKSSPTGTTVVALPLLRGSAGVDTVGLSVHAPGGYAEQMLIQESLMMPVPNGLGPDVAALTEPMAVAWHAVRRGEVGKRTVAIVIGCGPVGLAVILLLKAKGVRTVVASDFSSGRRALATVCGADVVVDPGHESPFTAVKGRGHLTDLPSALELAVGTREKLERLPFGWWHAWRLGEALGATPKHPVIFECVGMPGVIDSLIDGAPLFSRVVVVGVCVGVDQITPAMAINKEIDLRFVLGYTPLEFRDTLSMLAEGEVDPRPLITATVGLDGVDTAFTALGSPDVHAKILIDPRSPVMAPATPQRLA